MTERFPVIDPYTPEPALLCARNNDERQNAQRVINGLYEMRDDSIDPIRASEEEKRFAGFSMDEKPDQPNRKRGGIQSEYKKSMNLNALSTIARHASNGLIKAELDQNNKYYLRLGNLEQYEPKDRKSLLEAMTNLGITHEIRERTVSFDDPAPGQKSLDVKVNEHKDKGKTVAVTTAPPTFSPIPD